MNTTNIEYNFSFSKQNFKFLIFILLKIKKYQILIQKTHEK